MISAKIQCARFEDSSSVSFLDEQTLEGDVISQIEAALAFVKRNTRQGIRITGNSQHERLPEYPEKAVREAVTNAVCHRDYISTGTVQIRIYDDRLEVWNPGALPSDLTVEDLFTEHPSRPRNPLLAEALHRARVIERWGTGTLRILAECKAAGMPQPQFTSEQGTFKIRLLGLAERLFLDVRGLPERQRRAVAYVQERGRITTGEFAHLVSIGERTARRDLTKLVEQGIFDYQEAGPKSHYLLKIDTKVTTS